MSRVCRVPTSYMRPSLTIFILHAPSQAPTCTCSKETPHSSPLRREQGVIIYMSPVEAFVNGITSDQHPF